eukprot:scaffold80477_cov71-Phaeocystis_antarctica.AAC.3
MSSTTALMQADVSGRRRSSEGASASASFLTCSRRRSSKMETNLLERKRGDVSLGHGPHAGARATLTWRRAAAGAPRSPPWPSPSPSAGTAVPRARTRLVRP